MDIKQLRQLSEKDLANHMTELQKEQFALRMQKATGQMEKTHEIRRVRREIARAKMQQSVVAKK
ncbi:MAG: 50S ribosomal protein L29 [Xanthomonadales bacterium]|nr:50S ribosomal protein L29 [Xanthomonadales bacterium]